MNELEKKKVVVEEVTKTMVDKGIGVLDRHGPITLFALGLFACLFWAVIMPSRKTADAIIEGFNTSNKTNAEVLKNVEKGVQVLEETLDENIKIEQEFHKIQASTFVEHDRKTDKILNAVIED